MPPTTMTSAAHLGHPQYISIPVACLLTVCLASMLAQVANAELRWGRPDPGEHNAPFEDHGCKSPGYRAVSARLLGSNSRKDWESDCKKLPYSPNKFETFSGEDTECKDRGIFNGEWGSWLIFDKGCQPHWDKFKDEGCVGQGFRQYSSILRNVPHGKNTWEDWCKVWPADIKGPKGNMEHFYAPDSCKNKITHQYGYFDMPDNSCCGNDGKERGHHEEIPARKLLANRKSSHGNHDELPSRKLLADGDPPRCDVRRRPPILTAAAFLRVLLRHDRPLLQLDNAAIVGQRPPAPVQNGARVPTVLRRRDIYNRDGTLADGFHVPIYEAYPRDADPPPNQHVDSSDSILSVWVPPYMVGVGPLNTSSFNITNEGGVIDIPEAAFVRIDARGPDVMFTSHLTGCAFLWAFDRAHNALYVAHLRPHAFNINPWARNGNDLATNLQVRARFHGTTLNVNVFGRNGFGYNSATGNIAAIRNGNTGEWDMVAQTFSINPLRHGRLPADVINLNYDRCDAINPPPPQSTPLGPRGEGWVCPGLDKPEGCAAYLKCDNGKPTENCADSNVPDCAAGAEQCLKSCKSC